MEIQEAEIGRKVIYTPYEGCDPLLKEEGIITSVNKRFIFVRYGRGINSRATSPSDLTYI